MNNGHPVLLSVIIPVYNVERYLGECLDSVLQQTLGDIEIICVNDGSTDGSRAILGDYAARDPRLTIIDLGNEGQAVARNCALERVAGEYIVFVDSDDRVDRDLCRKVYERAVASRADMVMYDYSTFTEDSGGFSRKAEASSLVETDATDKKKLLGTMGVVWTKCLRTEFVRSNMIRFPAGRIYEDVLVHWKCVILARKIEVLKERLYYYRIQPTATTYRTDWQITDRIFILDMVRDFLVSGNFYGEYRDEFLRSQLEAFHWLYDTIDAPHKKKVMELIGDRLGEDHWHIIGTAGELSWKTKDFFRAMRNFPLARCRRTLWLFTRRWYRGIRRLARRFALIIV